MVGKGGLAASITAPHKMWSKICKWTPCTVCSSLLCEVLACHQKQVSRVFTKNTLVCGQSKDGTTNPVISGKPALTSHWAMSDAHKLPNVYSFCIMWKFTIFKGGFLIPCDAARHVSQWFFSSNSQWESKSVFPKKCLVNSLSLLQIICVLHNKD